VDRGMDSDRPWYDRRELAGVNIATGNAVVGQQIAGTVPDTVEVFAWVVDYWSVTWRLRGIAADGMSGLYERADGITRPLGEIDDTLGGHPCTPGPLVAWIRP
jgi:hypothetical protein